MSVDDLEAQFAAVRQKYLEALPEHLRTLGDILRRTVAENDLAPLAKFLAEQEIEVAADKLEHFRDLLIVRRLDLKDLEPDARQRLRSRVVAIQDSTQMTADYVAAKTAGAVPRCRGCRYFVTPPNDGSVDGDKACVSFGTRGGDEACYGYTV
jgi:hypothetical protein